MVALYVGSNQVDLFGDENIEMNMVTRDFFNLSVSTANYTNTFTVPASDRNNGIFNLYFDEKRVVTDDYRFGKAARIEMDGVPFQSGYIIMSEGVFSMGKIQTYTVNFYTYDVALFQYLENVSIKELDWTSLNGEVTAADTRQGMIGDGSVSSTIFPFIQKFYQRQDPTTSGGANEVRGKWTQDDIRGGTNAASWRELRPALRCGEVWERIVDAASDFNVVLQSDYFSNNLSFERMYMYLPYQYSDEEGVPSTSAFIEYATYDTSFNEDVVQVPTTVINVDLAKDQSNARSCQVTLTLNTAQNPSYIVTPYISEDNGATYQPLSGFVIEPPSGTTNEFQVEFTRNTNGDATHLKFEFFTAMESLSIGGTYRIEGDSNQNGGNYNVDIGDGSITSGGIVNPNENFTIRVPDIKVNDWMRWQMKMFNMVVWSDDGVNYWIEPYDVWLSQGATHDLSHYIDMTAYNKSTIVVPKTFSWRYEETKSIGQTGFKNLNSYQYGDLYENVIDPNSKQRARGEEIDYEVGYSIPLWEKVFDQYLLFSAYESNFDTIDDEYFLMYYSGDESLPVGEGIDFDGWSGEITSYKLCNNFYPHVGTASDSLLFKEEVDPNNTLVSPVSLYSKYYQNYYQVLLDPQARIFKYEGYLPTILFNKNDANRFNVNSTVKIGDTYYIINKYQVNLTTGKTSLELFNIVPDFSGELPPPVDTNPPDIGVLSVNCTNYALTWTASPTAVEYQIYQATENQEWTQVGTTTGLTYTPTNIEPNIKVYWKITATDSNGNKSLNSNIVSCWGALGFEYKFEATI